MKLYRSCNFPAILFILLLLNISTASADQLWNVTINATNQLEPVTLGYHPNATDEYDMEFDEYTRNPVQSNVILALDKIFSKSIKKDHLAWDLLIGVPEDTGTTLTWNASNVPPEIELIISNETTEMNIRTHTSLNLTGGAHNFLIALSQNDEDDGSNSDRGGGSSSGGGGGGGPSGENFANIEVKEKYDMHIYKDEVTSYTFTHTSNPVMFVNITGKISAGEINTAVEVLKNSSTLVNDSAPGTVYKNLNIWVGTSGFATPRNIKEAWIKFRVENSWINDHADSDVMMARWNGNKWEQLETIRRSKDDTYTYFEAKTNRFSPFAITGIKAEGGPVAGAPEITEQPVPSGQPVTAAPKEDTPGFGVVLAITILSAVSILRRKRN